ncbi:DUF6457 domain-containing protein [Prauserella oleivorans]|uniref:DUF6457 domain-containing protein n=1 Tax=Prauserella oleivorans TaxID=1478153 RepID=A0ABW5WGF9_9PSEU
MNELREWTATLCADLGLDDARDLDCAAVVAMARNVGRVVSNPAGPVTAFLVGMAVARGLSPADAAARLDELTRRWPRIDWRD